jgi:hypothetical protein
MRLSSVQPKHFQSRLATTFQKKGVGALVEEGLDRRNKKLAI